MAAVYHIYYGQIFIHARPLAAILPICYSLPSVSLVFTTLVRTVLPKIQIEVQSSLYHFQNKFVNT